MGSEMEKDDSKRTFNISIQIRGLDNYTNRILNTLALLRGKTKSEVMKDALVYYAKTFQSEIAKLGGEKRG